MMIIIIIMLTVVTIIIIILIISIINHYHYCMNIFISSFNWRSLYQIIYSPFRGRPPVLMNHMIQWLFEIGFPVFLSKLDVIYGEVLLGLCDEFAISLRAAHSTICQLTMFPMFPKHMICLLQNLTIAQTSVIQSIADEAIENKSSCMY